MFGGWMIEGFVRRMKKLKFGIRSFIVAREGDDFRGLRSMPVRRTSK